MRRVYLNFHGIDTPERALEPGEAAYWISRDLYQEILDLAETLRDRVETRFTFDDGNISDLAIGAEGLARIGRTATFFILSRRIGAAGSLGEEAVRTLQARGHGIGSHGAAHRDWTTLDAAGRDEEFDDARDRIQAILGRPVTEAAIPFGRYNRTVLETLRVRGYTRVYSSDGGAARTEAMPVPRTSVTADMEMREIENILLGREPLSRRVRRRLSRTAKRMV